MTMMDKVEDAHIPVPHGFFGRRGGVSEGVFSSLNCGLGSGDHPDHIAENRRRVCAALGAGRLLSLRQVHSALCHSVDRAWDDDARPEGDGLVTDRPGIALGVLSADCGPVLFYGEKSDHTPVIGAAHAGWGGALRGVLENTVQAMCDLGAELTTIRAALGPCIGPKSYEVGADFPAPFIAHDPQSDHFFRSARQDGHSLFDLPGYIAFRLAGAGVGRVSICGIDTYAQEESCFSYRRSTHRAESAYGRQISALVIPE